MPSVARAEVAVLGDSLLAGAEPGVIAAFERHGISALVDARSSRALRRGFLCRENRRLVVVSRPTNTRCRPEGLELVSRWARAGELPGTIVLALGTNDSGLFPPEQAVVHLAELARLTPGSRLVAVSVAKRDMPERTKAWNRTLAAWCHALPRCTYADWASTATAQSPSSYFPDGVHLRVDAIRERIGFLVNATRQIRRTATVPVR